MVKRNRLWVRTGKEEEDWGMTDALCVCSLLLILYIILLGKGDVFVPTLIPPVRVTIDF